MSIWKVNWYGSKLSNKTADISPQQTRNHSHNMKHTWYWVTNNDNLGYLRYSVGFITCSYLFLTYPYYYILVSHTFQVIVYSYPQCFGSYDAFDWIQNRPKAKHPYYLQQHCKTRYVAPGITGSLYLYAKLRQRSTSRSLPPPSLSERTNSPAKFTMQIVPISTINMKTSSKMLQVAQLRWSQIH